MSEQERKVYLKRIADKRKELEDSPKAAHEFLVRLGVITEKGNIRKRYKEACIQLSQG